MSINDTIGCVNHDCDKCKVVQGPVAFKVIKGELCYKSEEDDQSFGMWCPVTPQTDLPFVDGTEFYTTAQKKA